MSSVMSGFGRSLLPLSPRVASAPAWSARKRLLFVVGSSSLLWYAIVRLATAI